MGMILANDFTAGWVPSDDAVQGRKNGLLRMQSLTLDKNGALNMVQGIKVLSAPLTGLGTLHTFYTKKISSTEYKYYASNNGVVYRNGSSIETGGSTTRAGFCAAYGYVFGFSGDKRFKDTGASATDLGIIKPSAAPTVATGAAGVLTGDYEYCQINVLRDGTYQAKSARGAISAVVSPIAQQVTVTPQNPSVPSSTANEAWIFRRGGNLEEFYRIAVVTSYGSFSDNTSDDDVLALGITLNNFLLSINSSDTPEAILAAVGPIYNRLIYFTATKIIFSDIQSPDSYDSRTPIGLGASAGSEVFLWALKVSANVVLVGTNVDVYILTGTYKQLPDGYLDITLKPLAVTAPPVSIHACLYENSVLYMSLKGWVACATDGSILPLTPPNLDALYKYPLTVTKINNTYPSYTTDAITAYDCAIFGDKFIGIATYLDVSLATHHRIEVFDFIRKYWAVAYDDNCPLLFSLSEAGGYLYGYDSTGNGAIKIYFYGDVKTIEAYDSSIASQAVELITSFLDDGKPRNRKDIGTLTIRGYTGHASTGVTVSVALDGSSTFTALAGTFASVAMSEMSWDLSGAATDPGNLAKCISVKMAGTCPDFYLADISITYEDRPIPSMHLTVADLGMDSVERKFPSAINPIINTNGQNVRFYPVIDGVVQDYSTINTSKKLLASHFFTNNENGQIFTGYFVAQTTTPFEFYGFLPATISYKQGHHIKGSVFVVTELFRYGKIKEIEIRISALAGLTSVPYTMYLDNGAAKTGTITVKPGVEDVYQIDMTKEDQGSMMVLILGPTSVGFCPMYARAKVNKSGKDTDMTWIALTGTVVS